MTAAVIMLLTILMNVPSLNAWGEVEYYPGMTMLSGSGDWKFYCIDSYELLHEAGGVQGTNEWYAYVIPSTRLSEEETAILFWAALTLRAAKGDSQECKTALDKINANAPAAGLSSIKKAVTEADMKTMIHLQSTRDKYPWLKDVLANEETYLKLAGLLGGSGTESLGGNPIPAILQNHDELSAALPIDSSSYTLEFDPAGADREFIQKVPLLFSVDGSVFAAAPPGGWTYQKTDTSIIFSNPDPAPPALFIRFDPGGTEYQSGRGYRSVQEAYDMALQLWVCIECNDRHVYHSQKKLPLEAHQRLVYLAMDTGVQQYYASIGGASVNHPESGSLDFKVYRHEEEMQSTYRVQLYKYDHETGKPLENSVFKLYERFDDKDEIDKDRDGPVHIYEGGEPYKSYHTDNPATWDGFRFVSGVSCDQNGHAEKTINHGYHYDKTFCDGHPAPRFVSVPEEEEEEDEETGETSITNEGEIEAAQAENKRLAQSWLTCYSACEAHASGDFEGVHFHWLMPEVDRGEIERICSSGGDAGETPDAGRTDSASGEESYRESGCEEDCRQTYDKFISLRYSYAFVESTARHGYMLHGTHRDDLPIEIITTDASEHGANAVFSGEYSNAMTVNDAIAYNLADETLERRKQIAEYQLSREEFGKTEEIRLKQKKETHIQPVVRYLDSGAEAEEGLEEDDDEGDIGLIDDIGGDAATPSNMIRKPADTGKATPGNATPEKATPGNAASNLATPSNLPDRAPFAFSRLPHFPAVYTEEEDDHTGSGSSLFQNAYNSALHAASTGDEVPAGPKDNYSHCNDRDEEHNAWRIYDHRTEGEVHINKKDMDLEAGESADYDAYGDAQGDGTLEGAVYGLFAAADIIHPDGKTGVVYRANHLVAVAATDRNGDASFMVNTVQPGYHYDYEAGRIVPTGDGWADAAPANLYTDHHAYDDYTEDQSYERIYADYEEINGNCWIGRSLLLGNYYVKELTRSEGYELSIGNRDSAITNRGQDAGVALPVGAGYANISQSMYAEGQISANPTGEYGNPDVNELFFTAESKGTGADGFDLVFSRIPDGAKLYRLDTGMELKEVQTGTGVYDLVYLTHEDGRPRYAVAEHDYQYPRYNQDGSLMTEEISVNYKADRIPAMLPGPLDVGKTQKAMEAPEPGLGREEIARRLAEPFRAEEAEQIAFVKSKTERALRANGKNTPRAVADGNTSYSTIEKGIYDVGVRKGEADEYGISGVAPGEPAAETVFGSPVTVLEFPKTDEAGNELKTGDIILTILDYYHSNSFYSYGGIHEITGDGNRYLVTIYASCGKATADFVVPGEDLENDSIIFRRVPYLPDDRAEAPRYLYACYSGNEAEDTFGIYTDYKGVVIGGTYFASAVLVTDAVAAGDGSLITRTGKQNVYYKTGEIPRDKTGRQIQAFEYRERTVTTTQETDVYTWKELELREADEVKIARISSAYTDSYGMPHDDTELQSYFFRILLPEREVTLRQEDLGDDLAGWSAGEQMGSATYWLKGKRAKASACLNASDLSVIGDSSFVKPVTLAYPGQEYVWQDGENRPGANTVTAPLAVQERAIRQKIRIAKTIDAASYGDTNTYAQVHEDWFTRLFATKGQEARTMDNFYFKIYLKSNLERLYRDEDGRVSWMDRNGNLVDITAYTSAFPEKVQKIYTKVPHTPEIRKNSEETVIANRELYSFSNGVIREDPNPGYTAVLETVYEEVQDDLGQSGIMEYPDYQKFFDAIRTANTDRWNNPLTRGREFTTWEAWDAVRNAWEGIIDPAVSDTSYKPFARILSGRFCASEKERSSDPAVHNGAETKNEVNTSDKARKNAMSSDAVRQFAITWYLEEEVKKLVQTDRNGEAEHGDGSITYPDEVYDIALHEAIKKANNYLKPFFFYNLDEIYAVAWDAEADGGKDGDPATLCADTAAGDVFYGVSAYLPYGTYVAVEQQPYNFYNKHYQTDKPKEIILPAVYEEEDSGESGAEYAGRYQYRSAAAPEDLASGYQIRFHEEWAGNHTDDIRSYVIRARNDSGDFEVYPYGLDVDRLTGSAGGRPYDGWKVTQDTYDPIKDYYNDPLVNTREEGGNPDSHYYPSDEIEKRYHYGSISEDGQIADKVLFSGKHGTYFKNRVPVMKGEQTACEGRYAPMLVPWTMTEPANAADEAEFAGYAKQQFENAFYSVKLRIEKLDCETGESLLHDQAIFALYAADRDDSENGQGRVRFYERPTVITGSREFLEAMGATDLFTLARGIPDPELSADALWYGTVPEGTPVCREAERIVLQDRAGNKTGEFQAFTTKRDGAMREEPEAEAGQRPGITVADQNTGYLELPQPIGSGVYVLAEIKPPSGYARSKPVAVEVYSDQVSYYMEGSRDSRVASTVYKDQARVYVGNTPIRLEVSKKKTDDKTVTYRLSGRVEGSVTELNGRYGLENLELAYNASGTYLGYGWRKGMIEAVAARKAAGEEIEILYEDGVFSGCAEVTRPLLTAGDTNRYVAGATLTLYDAIAVKRNGDSQDYGFDGVTVERDRNSNVTRIYVREGYAGAKTEFVQKKKLAAGGGVEETNWTYQTIPRSDTDLLFYSLGNLSVLWKDSSGKLWSYDKEGKPARIVDGMTKSIFALQNSRPAFEIVCSDFGALTYDQKAKAFTQMPPDTIIYHLDADGQRDAMVDAYTGMAYAEDSQRNGEVMVWPVTMIRDRDGSVIAKHKIRTNRIASIHADTAEEYITGTYQSAGTGSFEKWLNPILNSQGQAEYYQRSEEMYTKSSPVYDRDGDFFYDRYNDNLTAFNEDAYIVKGSDRVWDKGALWDEEDNRDEKLYMRQGDNYILENTWVSGDLTPNDPFDVRVGAGQADMLKRVAPGTYIMEELVPPEGWAKAFPLGVTVEETGEIQQAALTDETIKAEIFKLNAPEDYRIRERDYDGVRGRKGEAVSQRVRTAKKGAYTYLPVAGARLALYRARKVYTTDTTSYPKGWYLVKTEKEPASWTVYDERNQPSVFTAVWTSTEEAFYLEGIPAGNYILEESAAPSGYVRTTAWLDVKGTGEVQTFWIGNDHTKLEIFKYQTTEGKKEPLPNRHAAVLGLYPAVTDENGDPVTEAGIPLYQEESPVETWTTDDCRQYTSVTDLAVYEKWGMWERMKSRAGFGRARYSGFEHDYEAMYREYGTGFDELHWFYTEYPYDESGGGEIPNLREGIVHLLESHEADRSGCVTQLWELDDGRRICITVAPTPDPLTGEPFVFEYQYHFRRLDGNMVSYDTQEGFHRIDYIPWDDMQADGDGRASYVLAELVTPEGYEPADPKLIRLYETADVQLYAMENKPEPTEPERPPEETEPEETTPEETTPEETTRPEPTEEPEEPETTAPPETTEQGTEPETTSPAKPDRPDREEPATVAETTLPEPENETRIGRITARYEGGRTSGSGRSWRDAGRLSRTGDHSLGWLWLTLFSISGVGMLIGVRRRRFEKRQKAGADILCRCAKDEKGQNRADGVVGTDGADPDECCNVSGGTGRDGTDNHHP